MLEPLDPILHSRLRLAIISLLVGVETAEFNYLLDHTGSTRGNLSVQITRLKEAGYIRVEKTFRNNYPLTRCSITKKGVVAFENYVKAISTYLDKNNMMNNK